MDITAQVITDFRDYFPEFADDAVWSDTQVERQLVDADEETGPRWGPYKSQSLKARGMFNYAAHKLVLRKAVTNAVASGKTPGAPAQANSKTVGDETVSYAVQTPESGNAANGIGDFRTTIYGQEFLRLRRRAGMGAVTTGTVHP